MQRITEKQLETLAKIINEATGNPTSYFTKRRVKGQYRAAVGHFCISYAYGGAALHQISNEAGGVRDVLRSGHVPKRELYSLMQAYLTALRDIKSGDVKVKKHRR